MPFPFFNYNEYDPNNKDLITKNVKIQKKIRNFWKAWDLKILFLEKI